MADATNKQAVLRQCLSDIGYDAAEIEVLIGGSTQALLQSLTERKQHLMSGIHKEQKSVDCLDYLVYQIRRGSL